MLLSKHGKAFSQTKHSMHILVACVFSKEIWLCAVAGGAASMYTGSE
jgi:hypothetical protein